MAADSTKRVPRYSKSTVLTVNEGHTSSVISIKIVIFMRIENLALILSWKASMQVGNFWVKLEKFSKLCNLIENSPTS